MQCLLRRTYVAAELFANHPPVLRDPNKQLVYQLACPDGATHGGSVEVTRWGALPMPALAERAATEVVAVTGFYDYRDDDCMSWHVNFADPRLFYAYGSALLAQDELQAAEHPVLGAIREALVAEDIDPMTDEDSPTPFLVEGAERRCAIDTASSPERPFGMYGNRFARASDRDVRGSVRVIDPPTRSNLIAIAAPTGRGPYWRGQLENILVTAMTGFTAAKREAKGRPIEICTGYWGCGAFGGNRRAMTLLQILAAQLAGVARLRFYGGDDLEPFQAGVADLASVTASHVEPLSEVIDRIDDLDYEWGTSDGN